MTATDELLWNHYIDNEDYDGAAAITAQSPEALLRQSADGYLQQAIESGEVRNQEYFRVLLREN